MKNLYIGIDIGGSKTRSVALENLKPVRFFEIRYDAKRLRLTAVEMKKILVDAVDGLQIELKKIKAIGVAYPSLIINGKPYFSHNNPALKNLQIDKFLGRRYKALVRIENDLNLAALGEWFFGFKSKSESLFLLNLGTGCGSGFVKQGKLFRGYRSSAFELGHMQMGLPNLMGLKDNLKCGCGAGFNHVECYISSWFFKYRGLDGFKEAQKAAMGNKKSLALFNEFGSYLGYTVVGVLLLLDPEAVVLTGGLAEAHKFFLKRANQICQTNKLLKNIRPNFKIQLAKTGNNAAALGAALWATGKYS